MCINDINRALSIFFEKNFFTNFQTNKKKFYFSFQGIIVFLKNNLKIRLKILRRFYFT